MRNWNNVLPLVLIGIMGLALTACSSEEVGESVEEIMEEEMESETTEGDTLTIYGLDDGSMEFTLEEVMAEEAVEQEISSTTSSGEILTVTIKGTLLDDLLGTIGYSVYDCESIRFVASDGYEISVPADIIATKDIIIAYEEDGEMYEEYGAFRMIIPDERAMYWVQGTVELHLEYGSTVSSQITQLVFLENVGEVVELEDYDYNESMDQALSIDALIQAYVTIGDATSGIMIASDGMESEQTLEVLQAGYIKMTGENAPLFTAQDMPEGMQIKGIQYMNIGNTCFVSTEMLMSEDEDVKLSQILSNLGMEGMDYTAIDTDGNETILEEAMLETFTFLLENDVYYLVDGDGDIKIAISVIEQ